MEPLKGAHHRKSKQEKGNLENALPTIGQGSSYSSVIEQSILDVCKATLESESQDLGSGPSNQTPPLTLIRTSGAQQ